MDLNIRGKRALVFASSQGLGKAVAQELIAEGARVIISSRNAETLAACAEEIGAEGFIPCDLLVKGAARTLTQSAVERLGGLDILVTNAGGPPKGSFDTLSSEHWEESFQSLFMSVVESMQVAIPEMSRSGWGRILLITSVAGKEPIPNLTVSSAIRAGVHGLVNAVSKEVGTNGITINAILPTFTATERLHELKFDIEAKLRSIPMRRLGKPDELGKLAAFLASDVAGFITGQAIAYDGGALASI
jgi:3-oxoacyl-[acyl-carrier protein] reductase